MDWLAVLMKAKKVAQAAVYAFSALIAILSL